MEIRPTVISMRVSGGIMGILAYRMAVRICMWQVCILLVMLETYFAVSLGAYDTQEAVETLPAQLELLRTLRDLERPDVALVYRLQTIPSLAAN